MFQIFIVPSVEPARSEETCLYLLLRKHLTVTDLFDGPWLGGAHCGE